MANKIKHTAKELNDLILDAEDKMRRCVADLTLSRMRYNSDLKLTAAARSNLHRLRAMKLRKANGKR